MEAVRPRGAAPGEGAPRDGEATEEGKEGRTRGGEGASNRRDLLGTGLVQPPGEVQRLRQPASPRTHLRPERLRLPSRDRGGSRRRGRERIGALPGERPHQEAF